jgi:Bacterial Ig domain
MRVFFRIVLVAVAAALPFTSAAFASHLEADCPLQLVASNPPASAFYQSPHGVFRFGTQVFALRGQTLTTYTVTDLGDLTIAREDFVGTLGARESNGGVAFNAGFMYISSEAGLEVLDLRNVRPGGNAPLLVSRMAGLHYRRMAVSPSNILAAVYPSTDLPCAPLVGSLTCFNNIDLYDVSNTSNIRRVGQITSFSSDTIAFNDVAFNYGFLVATGVGGTFAYNISTPASPVRIATDATPGIFLASNGANFLAIGNDGAILTEIIQIPGPASVFFNPFELHTLAALRTERTNPIAFHHQAWIDDAAGRLITMVDEVDPHTMLPARTFAFDTFDYAVPMFEGKDPRLYEQVSYTMVDEVKYNPVAVGPYVYVIGERSGLQSYGVCGQMDGRIEWESPLALPCGGAEIHGWVTGATKIANVELFLDGGSLGAATLTGPPRTDIPSTTPVTPWRINVNLDAISKGEHTLRAVGTDILGNRRQFSSVRVVFGGPGQNCFVRRRSSGK